MSENKTAEGETVCLNDLLSCPCGQIPSSLYISEGQCSKWAYVSGNCCNEWNIEFRTQYLALDSEECMKLAIEEWNDATRAR